MPRDMISSKEINGSIFAHDDGNKESELRQLFKKNKKIKFAHMVLTEVKDYFGENIFNSAFKVSTIRNPYVHAVSEFNHLFTRNRLPKRIKEEVDTNLTLFKNDKGFRQKIFLKYLEERIEYGIINHLKNFYFINDVYQLNYLIRQEKINQDLTTLFEKIGVEESLKNEVLLLTNTPVNLALEKYKFYEYLNKTSLKLINQYQSYIFKLGNYEKVNNRKELFDSLKKFNK